VACVQAVRRDGLTSRVLWSVPLRGEDWAPARGLDVPPFTFVADARGTPVLAPQAYPQRLELPAATTPEAGGAVRVLL